jgi:hypothetical protein
VLKAFSLPKHRQLQKDISAEQGIVATGYERKKWGELSRLAQFSKMHLFYGASAVFSCPLAMTDGGSSFSLMESERCASVSGSLFFMPCLLCHPSSGFLTSWSPWFPPDVFRFALVLALPTRLTLWRYVAARLLEVYGGEQVFSSTQ